MYQETGKSYQEIVNIHLCLVLERDSVLCKSATVMQQFEAVVNLKLTFVAEVV